MPIVILVALVFGLVAGNRYVDNISKQHYLEANQTSKTIILPIESITPTETPLPTLFPTLPPPTISPSLTPTQTPALPPTVVPYKPPDPFSILSKCLNDKENDPITKQLELDRTIYINPNSTPEEKNAALARISTNNEIISRRYDCFKTSYTQPTAICNDWSYSYSQNRSGTCSYHGGVRQWLIDLSP